MSQNQDKSNLYAFKSDDVLKTCPQKIFVCKQLSIENVENFFHEYLTFFK